MSESVFDPRHLLQSVDDDAELAGELIQAYMEDAPQRMERLRAAMATGSSEEAMHAVHSLKGMSGVVRAQLLVELTLKMEQMAKAGDMNGLAQRLPALEQALDRSLAEMGDFLDRQG